MAIAFWGFSIHGVKQHKRLLNNKYTHNRPHYNKMNMI